MAAEQILNGASEDVMYAGSTVGCWRPFIEDELRPAGAIALDTGKKALLGPPSEHLCLETVSRAVRSEQSITRQSRRLLRSQRATQ